MLARLSSLLYVRISSVCIMAIWSAVSDICEVKQSIRFSVLVSCWSRLQGFLVLLFLLLRAGFSNEEPAA